MTTAARERPDLRLAVPAITVWAAAALLARCTVATLWVVVVLAAASALLVALRRGTAGIRRPAVAATLLLVAGVASVTATRAVMARAGPLGSLAVKGASVPLTLVVTGDPQRRVADTGLSYVVLRATVTSVTSRGRPVRVRSPLVVVAHGSGWSSLLPSTHVRATARLRPPRQGAGDIVAVALATGEPKLLAGPSLLQRLASRLRDGLRSACGGLPGVAGGLVPGLVDGDVSRLPETTRDEFRVTGMTHLYAVSGTNVAVVLAAALALARRLGAGRRLGAVLAAAALGLFVVVARPSPSVLRAGVMGLVVLAGMVSGRRAPPLPALGAAVVVLLLLDPALARQPGFALSVLATVGILLLAPAWRERLSRRLPPVAAEAVAIPAAAQLACAPVLAAYFGQFSLAAVPANLLAAPAVAPATLLGVAAGLLAVVAPGAAALLAGLAGLPALWLLAVAHWGAALPGASLPWPAGWWGVIALAGLLGGSWLALRGRGRARGVALVATVGVVVAAVTHGTPPPHPPTARAAVHAGCSPRVRAILTRCPRPPP